MRNYRLKAESTAAEFLQHARQAAKSGTAILQRDRKDLERGKNYSLITSLTVDTMQLAACHYALENQVEWRAALKIRNHHSVLSLPAEKFAPIVFIHELVAALAVSEIQSAHQVARAISQRHPDFSKSSPRGLTARTLAALVSADTESVRRHVAEISVACREKTYSRDDCLLSAPFANAASSILTHETEGLEAAVHAREAALRRWLDEELKNASTGAPCEASALDFWDIEMTIVLVIAGKMGMPLPASPFFDVSWMT